LIGGDRNGENLPVASAAIAAASATTAAITAIATAPAATTTTMSAASATATTVAAASTATTTAATFPLRTCLIHHKRAAQKILSIERRNRFFRFGIVVYLSETESAWLSRETIAKQRE
jgi:hypothetical protein